MTRVKLLEVVSGFGLGGAERALLNRMQYLPSNLEVTVLNVRPEIDSLEFNLPIVKHQIERQGIFRLKGIYKFLRHNKFAAIIVRTPLDAIKFGFCHVLIFRHRPKLIFEAHSNFVSDRFGISLVIKFLMRIVSMRFDLVFAVSQSVLRGPLCRGHKRVEVVYLGGQLREPLPLAAVPQKPQFVFVGRLVKLKRPIWLLERMLAVSSKVNLPAHALTIIGKGPLEREIKEYIKTYNLEEFIDFVGEQKDITPYLLSASHLVSSSTHEGLPLTFFEAKLAGLAILATPSGGGAEIFDDYDRELETFEKDEFENALITIFSNLPPTLEDRKRIQANSSWMSAERCAREYYFRLSQLLQP